MINIKGIWYNDNEALKHLKRCSCMTCMKARDEDVEKAIAAQKIELIEEIDKVYKKEGGIHNWLNLRQKLLK